MCIRDRFRARHAGAKVKRADIANQSGALFLGIDAGSTTTKAALINRDKELVFEYYQSNEGDPLNVVHNIMNAIYDRIPEAAFIGRSVVTGYGCLLYTSIMIYFAHKPRAVRRDYGIQQQFCR